MQEDQREHWKKKSGAVFVFTLSVSITSFPCGELAGKRSFTVILNSRVPDRVSDSRIHQRCLRYGMYIHDVSYKKSSL